MNIRIIENIETALQVIIECRKADEKVMMADLSLLWQGAATQSDTINFALYKLSNPDEDKPDSKSVKSVLGNIASMSTLAGASMGSPMLAAGSLLGGNLLSIFSQDTKALNYKYTRVNDADMIITNYYKIFPNEREKVKTVFNGENIIVNNVKDDDIMLQHERFTANNIVEEDEYETY